MTSSVANGFKWLASGAKRVVLSDAAKTVAGVVKQVLTDPREAAGKLVSSVASAGFNYATSFVNGSNVLISQNGNDVTIVAQGAPEDTSQEASGTQIVSSNMQRAKKTFKYTMTLAVFAAMVHNRDALSHLPRELTRVIQLRNLSQLVAGLRRVVPTPQTLLKGGTKAAKAAVTNAFQATGLVGEVGAVLVDATRDGLGAIASQVSQEVVGFLSPVVTETFGKVTNTTVKAVSKVANLARRKTEIIVSRVTRAATQHLSPVVPVVTKTLRNVTEVMLTGFRAVTRFAGDHPGLAATAAVVGAAGAATVIARAYRARRAAQQAAAPYRLSHDAQRIHERVFQLATVEVVDSDGNNTRFDKLCINGRATANTDLQGKALDTKNKLRGLLSNTYQGRLDANADFGYTVDLKRGRLIITLPSSPTAPDEFTRYEYDLSDDTSIANFIDKFGRVAAPASATDPVTEAVTIAEIKAFLQADQAKYGVKEGLNGAIASVGNYQLGAADFTALFTNQSSNVLPPMLSAGYKELVLAQETKAGRMHDYYVEVLRAPDTQTSPAQKKRAEEQLELLRKINAKRTLEMARFLEHNMSVPVRRGTTTHYDDQDMSINAVIDAVYDDQLDVRELGVAFSKLVDYAKNLEGASKQSVSELVSLFIHIVSTKAQGRGGAESVIDKTELVMQSLRYMQHTLIQKDELIPIQYDLAICDLESKLASQTYDDFEAQFQIDEGENLDQALFDGSAFTEPMRVRMRTGNPAEAPVSAAAQTALRAAGATIHGGRPIPSLGRRCDIFAQALHGLNAPEVAAATALPEEERDIRHWLTYEERVEWA